eukprot:TRINITY_DN68199_c0_g1_i1.p1 TRINITY_DN68199_c0_g1~~TRINITY_DN68199_c0_g1_i1.p1  ORF type:complete len:216 (+),score=36.94 TRINITY_DN68199_c0_g1_i1:47-694(+)
MPLGPAAGSARALQRSREALELISTLRLPSPWLREGWCLYRCPADVRPSAKIAGFDFDKTLHFGGPAWRLSSAHVPGRLRQLYEQDGYKVVVFSNQHAAGKQRTREGMRDAVRDTIIRFDEFAQFCGFPIQMFVAVARGDINDPFRKPNTRMWDLMASTSCNGGVMPDPSQSFFVGNSAGRKTDGNDVDLQFAYRLGLEFRTEEWLRPVKQSDSF